MALNKNKVSRLPFDLAICFQIVVSLFMHLPGWIAAGYYIYTCLHPTSARLRFSRLVCSIQCAFLTVSAICMLLFGLSEVVLYFQGTQMRMVASHTVLGNDIVLICVHVATGLLLASLSYHSYSTAKLFKAIGDRFEEPELQLPTVQFYEPKYDYTVQHVNNQQALTGYPGLTSTQYYSGYPAPVQPGYSFDPQNSRVM